MTTSDRCDICPPKLALSLEEEEVLRRMRAVRAEARQLKQRLAAGNPQRAVLERDLERLRRRFAELKEELRRANREKLIRLGHRP